MKIKINVTKKNFFVLLGIMLILSVITGVIAYNSGGPASFVGHSSEEIDLDLNGDGIYEVSLKDALNQGLIGGGGVSCEWKEMEYYDCDSSGNCRARLMLVNAVDTGSMGACSMHVKSDNKYYFGYLDSIPSTSFENTPLKCTDQVYGGGHLHSDGSRYFDSTHKAYYYACS